MSRSMSWSDSGESWTGGEDAVGDFYAGVAVCLCAKNDLFCIMLYAKYGTILRVHGR